MDETVREIGDYRLSISDSKPGWKFLRLTDLSGQQWYAGILREREIPLEVLVQIERARAYETEKDTCQGVVRYLGGSYPCHLSPGHKFSHEAWIDGTLRTSPRL